MKKNFREVCVIMKICAKKIIDFQGLITNPMVCIIRCCAVYNAGFGIWPMNCTQSPIFNTCSKMDQKQKPTFRLVCYLSAYKWA